MLKRLRNKRGVVPAGLLFSGGSVVGSTFFCVAVMLIAVSQLPSVKADFRVKKAIAQCEASKGAQCSEMVASWSKEDVLNYIKDDKVSGNAGNFDGGYMN